MSKKIKKQFIGQNEIDFVKDEIVEKNGIKGKEVVFKGGDIKFFSLKSLEYVIKEEQVDETNYQNLIIDNIIKDMLAVLFEHDIERGHVGPILKEIFTDYDKLYYQSIAKKFGNDGKIHYLTYLDKVKISDL